MNSNCSEFEVKNTAEKCSRNTLEAGEEVEAVLEAEEIRGQPEAGPTEGPKGFGQTPESSQAEQLLVPDEAELRLGVTLKMRRWRLSWMPAS